MSTATPAASAPAAPATYDVSALRARFPSLRAGYAHFDGPGGSQVPDAVAEAVAATMLAPLLSERTRLVAVTGASNLIGTRPPVRAIADAAHAAGPGGRGALVHVDGVHLTAHTSVDVAALGADVFVCSPYKFLGPHCGVLAADPALLETLHPAKLAPSSDAVPERFERGTLPYELLAGTTAAVDVLAGIADGPGVDGPGDRRARLVRSMGAVEAHEDRLRRRVEDGLAALPGVTVWSRAAHRTPTLLLTIEGRDPAEAYRFLAERGVNAPASSFYALEASRRLGLGDGGALRVGLAPYSDDTDVDRLLAGIADFTA